MAEEKLNTLSQENEKLRVDNELKDRKIELLEQDLNLAKQGKRITRIELQFTRYRCFQCGKTDFQDE